MTPSQLRTTRTVVALDLSKAAFEEIATKLRQAGYDHCFMSEGEIDMHGIAVTLDDEAPCTGNYAGCAPECGPGNRCAASRKAEES